MFIVLDNAESILGLQGTNAQNIRGVVEELNQLETVCLCITSRISTVPPECEILDIPTLSMEPARDAFYRIYKNEGRSDLADEILEQLDFHPLSITLLAVVAHQNKWDTDRLAKEWKRHGTEILHTQHSESLAATIELSLASPMFQRLGSDARELLGVVAFFPQGINEENISWLFPAISDGTNIFDQFCILSLIYRSNGFITMLAPVRDYLRPKDPKSSPLLCTIKERYFTRLSADVDPDRPDFEDARWITSEDVNVEHLLDVFTSIDGNSGDIWDACCHFMGHLRWHKPRPVVLGLKIEGLPDNHPSKPQCLFELSQLFHSVGRLAESKQLLIHTLELCREREDDFQIAQASRLLADTDRRLGLYEEGIRLANEALQIHERLGDTVGQARTLVQLAWLLYGDQKLDAAEEVASRAISLLPEKGERFPACQCYRVLGRIYHSQGKTEVAIDHFEAALGIASTFNWPEEQFWIHWALARLFFTEHRFSDAQAHVERAKSHTVDDAYLLGRAMQLQAIIWYQQYRIEEAKSEALRTISVYEKLGAGYDLEDCRKLLLLIEQSGVHWPVGLESSLEFRGGSVEALKPVMSPKRGEPLKMIPSVRLINSPCPARGS